MVAIDLAELVGSAIALQLLFGLPLAMGNYHQLFLAAGILGATVMPHNL
jgi:Mn2+/Fe2+ NRAMP family transporter